MGPEALHGIQRTLRAPGGHGAMLLMFGACSMLMLAVLLQVYLSQWHRRRRLTERWRRFTQSMVRRRLSVSQRGLLAEMARREAPEDPGLLLQSLEAFERGVHRHLKPLISNKGGPAVEEAAGLVGGLRQALGFSRGHWREYFSTRELQEGQTVELYATARAETPICTARVATPREDYLELTDLRYAQPLTGRSVHAVFYSLGRRFDFETEPLHVDLPHGICRLAHTVDVRAVDQRENYRVEHSAPLDIRAQWEPEDFWRTAQLRNISAGGAALVAGCYYEEGEQLLVQLRPAEYLSPAALVEGEEFGARALVASVLEARRLPDERCLYRVEFRDVSPDDRRYLFRIVQKLQLHGQAATA